MTRARKDALLVALLVTAGPTLLGYVRQTYNGKPLQRASQIRFLVDPKVAPGLRNADGAIILTPESDPVSALRAAMQTWSSVPTAAVSMDLAVIPTYGPARDFNNTISFDDTPAIRSLVGSAIAVTLNTYTSTGIIVDSDTVFNPTLTFATSPTLGCFDLQSIATHELGHALGAGHSVLASATMFAYSDPEETWPRELSTDDIAFLNDAFPRNGALGGISGSVLFTSGGPVQQALVLVIDPDTGFVVAPYATGTAYSTGGLPAGSYLVAAIPVAPYATGDFSGLDPPEWQASFYGGETPQTVQVSAGKIAIANITVPDGPATLRIDFADFGIESSGLAGLIPSGGPGTIQVFGKGFTDTIRPEDIVFYGPGMSVEADSIHVHLSPDPAALGVLSFTVDVAPQTNWPDAVLTVRSGANVTVYSGLRIMPTGPQLMPSGVVNGASFAPGAIAPGEIVSILGSALVNTLGDTVVEFDGQSAPLFYASGSQVNAQVPFEVAARASTRVRVRHGDASSEVILPVAAASPAIFGALGQPAILNEDGSLNNESHPAPRGSTIVVYGNGQGVVDPPLATGDMAPADPLSRAGEVYAWIADLPARVDFAQMTPGFVGLLQLNVFIPDEAPVGSIALKLNIKGFPSNQAFFSVQ